MTVRLVTTLTVALLMCGFATLVYLSNPARPANRWFTALALTGTAWISALAVLAYGDPSIPPSLFVARLPFAPAALIPFCFLKFTTVFPLPSRFPSRFSLSLLGAASMLLAVLSFSPWLISDVTPLGSPRYGPLYLLFAAHFLICVVTSFAVLFVNLRTASGLAHLQLKYLALGLILSLAAGTTTNLLIPLIFQTSDLAAYGPFSVLLFIAFTTHAIVRYHLMDIRFIVRRGLSYLLALLIASVSFLLVLGALAYLTRVQPAQLPISVHLALVLVVALAFHPLHHLLRSLLDRYVYRRTYDYHRTIRDTMRHLASTLDLNVLTVQLCDITVHTLQPGSVALYLRDPDTRVFLRLSHKSVLPSPDPPHPESISADSPVVTFLSRTPTFLLAQSPASDTFQNHLQARYDLATYGATLALPLMDETRLLGILILSSKLSGDPYFTDDLDLLSTLTAQASIALKNAQLFNQVALANEHVERLLATIDSAVVAANSSGKITLFNAAAEALTGLPASAVISGPLDSLPHVLYSAFQPTLRDGRPRRQTEATLLDTSGRLHSVILSATPLHDRSLRISGAVMVLSDLTHLRELEAAQQRAERLASLGALASGLAHEIKNPLVAIRTFAELLPDHFADADFRHTFSQVVIPEIRRIDDLVARLRTLVPPPAPRLAPLDIRAIIDATLALLRAQLDQMHITIARLYASDVPPIAGDSDQLKQLLLNLLLNAVDAMPHGGQLAVRVSFRPESPRPILAVDISDTGTGIPASLLPGIFEPFVTSKANGSGLGLAICRRIADTHGAMIRASNNPIGPGATLSLEFPADLIPSVVLALKSA